jgi:HAMP domain-containing protein
MIKAKRLATAAFLVFIAWLFLSGWLNRPIPLTVTWHEDSDGVQPWEPFPPTWTAP